MRGTIKRRDAATCTPHTFVDANGGLGERKKRDLSAHDGALLAVTKVPSCCCYYCSRVLKFFKSQPW